MSDAGEDTGVTPDPREDGPGSVPETAAEGAADREADDVGAALVPGQGDDAGLDDLSVDDLSGKDTDEP